MCMPTVRGVTDRIHVCVRGTKTAEEKNREKGVVCDFTCMVPCVSVIIPPSKGD
jgi:hypothetical protein